MSFEGLAEGLLQGMVEAEGVELVHFEYLPKGAPPLLRVLIDKPGGVNHGDCQKVSKRISQVLDAEDRLRESYVLEVSSPGIERPLFKQEDYQRFLGHEVRLQALEKIDDRRRFTGFIRGVVDGVLRLEEEGEIHQIPWAKIKGARLVHRFE